MNELGRNQLIQLIAETVLECSVDNEDLTNALLNDDNDLKIAKKLIKKLQTKAGLAVSDNDISNKEFKTWREEFTNEYTGGQQSPINE